MDSGFQFIDIVLLAMVAGFIALRLRSVLGRRTGEERSSRELSGRGGTGDDIAGAEASETAAGRSEAVARLEDDPRLGRALAAIRRADPQFDVDRFLDGARAAYSLILEAFWGGEKETLRRFLSEDVYREFVDVIEARKAAGHTLEARLIDLVDQRITDLALRDGMVEVTVTFEAEIVSVTRDGEGRVVEGKESDSIRVVDIWTFARPAASADPNWTLVATHAG